eukprot:scaffold234_cov406-Prasinococcus_capsulatus_cf.AAC.1
MSGLLGLLRAENVTGDAIAAYMSVLSLARLPFHMLDHALTRQGRPSSYHAVTPSPAGSPPQAPTDAVTTRPSGAPLYELARAAGRTRLLPNALGLCPGDRSGRPRPCV